MDTDYSYDMDNYGCSLSGHMFTDVKTQREDKHSCPLSGHMFADVKTQREDRCMGSAKARIETSCQQDERICQLGQGLVNRQAYINAKVRVENTGKHFTERVFIDPGNLLHNGLAISYEFFKRSGLRLSLIHI